LGGIVEVDMSAILITCNFTLLYLL